MPTRHAVAQVGELAEGASRCVQVGHRTIALFHIEGQYYAIDDLCPHMGASLSGGVVEEGIVTCPLHAWRFRLSDGTWADNPRIKTGAYPVHVDGDTIQVELPDPPAHPA